MATSMPPNDIPPGPVPPTPPRRPVGLQPAAFQRRYYNPERSNRWQDWVILLVSIWFFFSPWILQFGHSVAANAPHPEVGRAAWNAWILAAIVFVVSLSAIGRMEIWQERWNAILGIWVFIAPWILGFAGELGAASWDHWVVGAIVFLCAISNLFDTRPHRVEAMRSG
ncbi:MAG TPA: SPW repeat protein [Acetobacteraceae bacterium]|jgi:hypothetical protein